MNKEGNGCWRAAAQTRERTLFFNSQKRFIGVFGTSRGQVSADALGFQVNLAVTAYKSGAHITNLLLILYAAEAALGDRAALKVLVFLVAQEEFLIQVFKLDSTES